MIETKNITQEPMGERDLLIKKLIADIKVAAETANRFAYQKNIRGNCVHIGIMQDIASTLRFVGQKAGYTITWDDYDFMRVDELKINDEVIY